MYVKIRFFHFFTTQKDLVLKWHQEKITTTEIHEKLVDIIEEKSISLYTVSRTIRQLSWTPSKDTDKESPERPPNLHNKRYILNELQENPEISCRQIARSTKIPYSTVNYSLIHRLNYKSVRTQYVRHILNEDDKMIKIHCCKEILTILKKCQRNGYRYIVAGDESWILYFTPRSIDK